MSDSRSKDFTRKIRELNQQRAVFVRRDHIEKERIYRGITLDQVWRALANGQIVTIRDSDSSVLWQGRDEDGRLLELNCTLKDEDGEITCVVHDACTAVVGTAYEPSVQDEAIKAKWLAEHPEYEDAGKRKGVLKKLVVTKI